MNREQKIKTLRDDILKFIIDIKKPLPFKNLPKGKKVKAKTIGDKMRERK